MQSSRFSLSLTGGQALSHLRTRRDEWSLWSRVPELQKQRVLLVDDDQTNRAYCAAALRSAALRSAGLEVIEAGGVREAHATAVTEQPHLIVIHLKPQTADLV